MQLSLTYYSLGVTISFCKFWFENDTLDRLDTAVIRHLLCFHSWGCSTLEETKVISLMYSRKSVGPRWPNDWVVFWVLICMVHFSVCYDYVTYTFHSESALYICLNIKEHLAWNRHNIPSLSDCNRILTHNHLVYEWTFNHLAKLT